jgi:hypothetical protein
LDIDPARIKVVGVHIGSVVADIEILDEAPSTVNETETELQVERLDLIVEEIVELAQAGELDVGYDIVELTIEPPVLNEVPLPPPTIVNATNSTNGTSFVMNPGEERRPFIVILPPPQEPEPSGSGSSAGSDSGSSSNGGSDLDDGSEDLEGQIIAPISTTDEDDVASTVAISLAAVFGTFAIVGLAYVGFKKHRKVKKDKQFSSILTVDVAGAKGKPAGKVRWVQDPRPQHMRPPVLDDGSRVVDVDDDAHKSGRVAPVDTPQRGAAGLSGSMGWAGHEL